VLQEWRIESKIVQSGVEKKSDTCRTTLPSNPQAVSVGSGNPC